MEEKNLLFVECGEGSSYKTCTFTEEKNFLFVEYVVRGTVESTVKHFTCTHTQRKQTFEFVERVVGKFLVRTA